MKSVRVILDNLIFKFTMWSAGLSDAHIREAFSYLTSSVPEFDDGDWRYLPSFRTEFRAWGNEVEVKVRKIPSKGSENTQYSYRFIVKEGTNRQVYIEEWRDEPREVILEYGLKHSTNWHEVYRSDELVEPAVKRALDYLFEIYQEVKCSSQLSKEPISSRLIHRHPIMVQ